MENDGTVLIKQVVPVDIVIPEQWPWEKTQRWEKIPPKQKVSKILWTLNLGGTYSPEIIKLTYPLMEHYAHKIGAEFRQIVSRKSPHLPPAMEKLQLFELGQGAEWNLFLDADTLVHPDFFDLTIQIPKDTVAHNGKDMAGLRWTYDEYFKRDGRNLGSCNWLALASDWCLDLWSPLDLPLEEALSRIHPVVGERTGHIDRGHLLDDFTLSRNIARYGLKHTTVNEVCQKLGVPSAYLFHHYNLSEGQKLDEMRQCLKNWRLE